VIVQDFGVNLSLVEELYLKYQDNPLSIDEVWRKYFERLENENGTTANGGGRYEPAFAHTSGPQASVTREPYVNGHAETATNGHAAQTSAQKSVSSGQAEQAVARMIETFRTQGHRYAKLDPLGLNVPSQELQLADFGLQDVPLTTPFSTNWAGGTTLGLGTLFEQLQATYCGAVGLEVGLIEDLQAKQWLLERFEQQNLELSTDASVQVLRKLVDAELFEQFVHTNYVGSKRFSLEGAESTIPLLEQIIHTSSELDVEEIVIGMAHRGRLNVLVSVVEKDLREIFSAFEDHEPELHRGRGDVKYHLGYSSDRVMPNGKSVHLSLCFNPSHLEFVNPVAIGRVRAKQDRRNDQSRRHVLPLLIHGDAAFMGQGVVPETLNLSRLAGYSAGGTIHVVINNQLGFTTSALDARSTRYATDIVRMLGCPVFHVNGENLPAVIKVARLAAEYRQQFKDEAVIDLYCYRRYGHNEADEPRFTQPLMYKAIDQRPTVRTAYAKRLIEQGTLSTDDAEVIVKTARQKLETALAAVRGVKFSVPTYALQGVWKDYTGGHDKDVPRVATTVDKAQLHQWVESLTAFPADLNVNPKVRRLFEERRSRVLEGKKIDWGTAEALAFASLLVEGTRVRISGQDSRRGTFSHRHAVIYDTVTGKPYAPAQHLSAEQARFEVFDSALSETAVLGFEYGYSLDSPDALVIWEAQFGDFINAGQVIVDQFITSSEDKWHRLSGVVLLLPHGFEGQGPEHSSARLERFLNACAEDNIQVCNLTTPAQLFHCLRRQIKRPYRKPLVIMSPKSLLRSPKAVSTTDELATGSFHRILTDEGTNPKDVRRVLLCSGKVYFDLVEARDKQKRNDVAILRLEQLYPLDGEELRATFKPYKDKTPLIWVQEEPWNMGGWFFIEAHLPHILEGRLPLSCVARAESASPATGSLGAHKLEQEELVRMALGE